MESKEKPKTVQEELDALKARTDKLDKEIHEAEQRHPPEIDHADDGGVI